MQGQNQVSCLALNQRLHHLDRRHRLKAAMGLQPPLQWNVDVVLRWFGVWKVQFPSPETDKLLRALGMNLLNGKFCMRDVKFPPLRTLLNMPERLEIALTHRQTAPRNGRVFVKQGPPGSRDRPKPIGKIIALQLHTPPLRFEDINQRTQKLVLPMLHTPLKPVWKIQREKLGL